MLCLVNVVSFMHYTLYFVNNFTDCGLNEIEQELSDEDAKTQEVNKAEENMGSAKLIESDNGQSQKAAKKGNTQKETRNSTTGYTFVKSLVTQDRKKEADSINKTQSKTRNKSRQRKVSMEVTNKAGKEEKIQKEKKWTGNQSVQQNNKKDANSQPKPESKCKTPNEQGHNLPYKYQTTMGLQRAI